MTLPTPAELMKKFDVEYVSIQYCNSRTIIKYIKTPVVAYGLGFGGFVIITKTKCKYLAYQWGCKRPYSSCSKEASFAQMTPEKAIEIIRTEPLFTERSIDEDAVKGMIEKQPKIISKFTKVDKNAYHTYKEEYFEFEDNKGKKFFKYLPTWASYYRHARAKDVWEAYIDANNLKKY